MTGNVAQVFVTDDEWMSALRASFAALRPGGHLVFEVRHPAREAWREWNREESRRRVDVAGIGTVETWVELTEVQLPLVAFRWTFVFEADGSVLTSESTQRISFWSTRKVRRASGRVVDPQVLVITPAPRPPSPTC